MSINIGSSPIGGFPQSSGGSRDAFDAAVASGISPVSLAGGQQLEEVSMLAKGWREAIAAADQGMRSLQVR